MNKPANKKPNILQFRLANFHMRSLTRIARNFSYHIRSPLDLKHFKPDALGIVKKSLSARFRDPTIADNVSNKLEVYRKNLHQLEQLNKRINLLQKDIKILKKNELAGSGDAELRQAESRKIMELSKMKSEQKNMEANLKQLVKRIEEEVSRIGNIVEIDTPVSKDESNNIVVSSYDPPQGAVSHEVPYSKICENFGLTDLKRGQKVGGHRGYFLKNGAVKLAMGLARYGLDFLEKKGYEIYQSPAIIAESVLKGSCQLQSIEEDVYKLEGMDSYLIATSQQSLAGLYMDEVLSHSQLPIRMGGYSTCFRKQAGAHGKDIHGLFRVHQFEKVEQFAIVEPQQSRGEMRRMMEVSEQFYQSLEIPYRVVNIVSGELNDAASCKLDLEAWYPSQKRYRQLVSVSNCAQYQSRLLRIQCSDAKNEVKFPHMLNGTLVAIQRALTCLVENNYRIDHLTVPKILQPYTGLSTIALPKSR